MPDFLSYDSFTPAGEQLLELEHEMNASGRRQRQAKNRYSHLAPRQRPNYKQRDLTVATARSAKKLAAQRERIARGAKH